MPVAKSHFPDWKKITIKPLHVNVEELTFASIITEFTDSWNPKWSPTEVYGRMDPISFYGSTSRELTLGFRVVSDNVEEAKENTRKAQKLIQYQYPKYKSVKGGGKVLYAPPYFRFSFLNVLQSDQSDNLYGYINSAVQINPGFQTKDQAQYFEYKDNNVDKIFFSDFTIVLRIQVLHTKKSIGWSSSQFSHGKTYPYGADEKSPPAGPAVAPTPTAAAAGSTNSADTTGETTGVATREAEEQTPAKRRDRENNINMSAFQGTKFNYFSPASLLPTGAPPGTQ